MTITAKIVQDSVNSITRKRITTMELEYPRFIHSEFVTHRDFSRNAASSRAIPVEKLIKMVEEDYAKPVHWGKNQPGMQASVQLEGDELSAVQAVWHMAAQMAARHARAMAEMGAHKQIVNRILEPFTTMKTVVTSTEWENFFSLRYHADAQPEIYALAKMMRYAMDNSSPLVLREGEWHVPYVEREGYFDSPIIYRHPDNGSNIGAAEAIRISASCCAQVSYRRLDTSLEKADTIYNRLIASKPIHASPMEHQACALFSNVPSGNFKGGWRQHRKDLDV